MNQMEEKKTDGLPLVESKGGVGTLLYPRQMVCEVEMVMEVSLFQVEGGEGAEPNEYCVDFVEAVPDCCCHCRKARTWMLLSR